MKRFLIYLVLLAAAALCYFVGFGEGIVALIVAYIVLEVVLASRLGAAFRNRRAGGS